MESFTACSWTSGSGRHDARKRTWTPRRQAESRAACPPDGAGAGHHRKGPPQGGATQDVGKLVGGQHLDIQQRRDDEQHEDRQARQDEGAPKAAPLLPAGR
ncbi:hypothetical protein B4Q13_21405 [Lacticaseibacillus rhamnosus]